MRLDSAHALHARAAVMSRRRFLFAAASAAGAHVAGSGSRPFAAEPVGASAGVPTDQGVIVYQVVRETDSGLGVDLVAVRPDGEEINRVEIGDVPLLFSPEAGGTVVASLGDGSHALFDPLAGTLRAIALPGTWSGPVGPAAWWRRERPGNRFALISDGTWSSAVLLDARSGAASDLVEIASEAGGGTAGADRMVLYGAFTPDEGTVVFGSEGNAWIMATDDPDTLRRIEGPSGARTELADDGSRLVYVLPAGEDHRELVVEALDGSERRVVASGDDPGIPFWIPGSAGSRLLLRHRDRIAVLDLETGEADDVFAPATGGLPNVAVCAPSGSRLLVRFGDDDAATWTWLDLETGERVTLDALAPYPPFARRTPGARYLYFHPTDAPTVEPGDQLLALDLETGELRSPLTFDAAEAEEYQGIGPLLPVSPDGRYAIVNDFGRSTPRFWLLDATRGTSRLVEGRIANAFSPDGAAFIAREQKSGEDDGNSRLVIMATETEDEWTLTESGSGLIWLPIPEGD